MNKITFVSALSALSFSVYTTSANAVLADVTAKSETVILDSSVTNLMHTMTSPKLHWQERFEAEKKLTDTDSESVLLALIPELSKKSPFDGFGIYNGSGSAQGDSRGPIKWQIFYALHRQWSTHVTKLFGDNNAKPPTSIGTRLIEHLAFAPSKGWILMALGGSPHSHVFWITEAEKPVVALLRDPKTEESLRAHAMECLLHKTGQKHYGEIKALFLAYPEADEKQLFLKAERLQMLIEHNSAKRFKKPKPPAIDNELVRNAFSMLLKLEKSGAGRGSHFARALGSYIEQEFQPDQNDPKYGGETFHNEVYHADTAANALAWWEKNQNSYPQEAR